MTTLLAKTVMKLETPNWTSGVTLPQPNLQAASPVVLAPREAVATCFRNPGQRVLTAHAMPRLSVEAEQSNHQSVTGPPVVASVSVSLDSSRPFCPLASLNCLLLRLSVRCCLKACRSIQNLSISASRCPCFCCCPSVFVC